MAQVLRQQNRLARALRELNQQKQVMGADKQNSGAAVTRPPYPLARPRSNNRIKRRAR